MPDPPSGQTYAFNSQCGVYRPATASGSGNTLTLTLVIDFASSFQGNRVVYAAARSVGDVSNSGWQPMGVWTVFPSVY